MVSSDPIHIAICAAFPESRRQHIRSLLSAYGTEPCERERERVQLAILKISEGREEKVREYVTVAKKDYRDVLFWADNPDQAKVDTPEKKKKIAELLRKLGVEPPDELK